MATHDISPLPLMLSPSLTSHPMWVIGLCVGERLMMIGWETEWNLAFACISALQEKTEGEGLRREREEDNEDALKETGMRAECIGIRKDRIKRGRRDEIKEYADLFFRRRCS